VNVRPVVDHLRAIVPALALAAGAAEYERALNALAALPAAFVLPAAEVAGENAFMDQMVQQEVAADFVVLLAVRNLSDGEGAAAAESLEPVRVAVRQALLGWTPDGATNGIEYAGGRLLAFHNGALWWEETYRTAYLIRSS
jgi:hypothetical protein